MQGGGHAVCNSAGMNERQQQTTTETAERGLPVGKPDSREAWPWLLGAGMVLLVLVVILAAKVLKPRDPRTQPPSSL